MNRKTERKVIDSMHWNCIDAEPVQNNYSIIAITVTDGLIFRSVSHGYEICSRFARIRSLRCATLQFPYGTQPIE